MLDMSTGRAVKVRALRATEAAALDGMFRAIMACNAVAEWASGSEEDEHPYYYVNRALSNALEDLYGHDTADDLLARVHNSGENPSYVIGQYFDGMTISE